MELELYEYVALKRDLPEYQLRAGDVAVLIDFVPHPAAGEMGCVLELFNALGDSIQVIVVPRSVVASLQANEILTVRSIA